MSLVTPSTSERDVRPERGSELVEVGLGVLDHVVQQRGGDRLLVEVELGADQGDAERVVDERLAGAAHLTTVGALGLVERAADQLLVDARVVRLDTCDQLVDEVVLMTLRIDDGHGLSLLVPFRVTGFGHPDAEGTLSPWVSSTDISSVAACCGSWRSWRSRSARRSAQGPDARRTA